MSKVVAVVGPTATGKSSLAIELAQRLSGEIVNADSMQLYQGMDVGTAKLSIAERQGIPHHLLDVWPVTKTASVAEYQALARSTIDALIGRAVTPVLVGGSGLYIRAALDVLDFPGTDADIRAQLEADLARVGAPAMHARLGALDPAAAAGILPTNGRRIVRALEVLALGRGSFQATMPRYESVYDVVLLGVDRPSDELDERIAQRVNAMWRGGLVAEVQHLAIEHGLRQGVTASRALGYRQVLSMIDGEYGEAEARERTVQATKRFVRRQRSWFRPDPRIRWLTAVDGPSGTDAAMAALEAAAR